MSKNAIQDGFIRYQLLRFCQPTRLQYTNSHILLRNRCVLQQQHVDCKIADAQHADGWDAHSKAWAHMVLHLPHADGGFGVTFNDVAKDAAFYTTTSRFVAWLGAFSQDVRACGCPRMTSIILRPRPHPIHNGLLANYGCKDTVPPQSQTSMGARVGRNMPPIPSQHKVTMQILDHWQPFRDLKFIFAGSRRAEELGLRSQQRIVATITTGWLASSRMRRTQCLWCWGQHPRQGCSFTC